MKKFHVPTSQGWGFWRLWAGVLGSWSISLNFGTSPVPTPGETYMQRQTQTREPLAWPRHLAEAARLFWKECGFNQWLPSARRATLFQTTSAGRFPEDFKVHANVLKGWSTNKTQLFGNPPFVSLFIRFEGHASLPIGPTARVPHMELTGRNPLWGPPAG